MSITFKRASKKQSRARIALYGPSGSGKTYTALAIATELAGASGKIAVMDSERGSASKYAGIFDFDCVDDLPEFGPLEYCKVIRAAEDAGYAVLVIDSLSHAWSGKGGALEQVDAASSRNPNKFAAWRDVTPQHNEMIDTILNCRMHVICTMRSKTEYVQDKDERTGKTTIRKVGLAPVQRDGMEYEFDLCGEMDDSNALTVTKSRCPDLARKRIQQPGAEFAKVIKAWLSDGAPQSEEPRVERIGQRAAALEAELASVGLTVEDMRQRIAATEWRHMASGPTDQWHVALAPKIAEFVIRRRNSANGANGNGNGHHNGTNGHKPATTPTQAPEPHTPVPGTSASVAPPVSHAATSHRETTPGAAGGQPPSAAPSPRSPKPRRCAWPVSPRVTPKHPAYWRARLEAAVAGYVRALTDDPHQLRACGVAALADGREAAAKVPEYDDSIHAEEAEAAAKAATDKYRVLVSMVEDSPDRLDWASAAIPF